MSDDFSPRTIQSPPLQVTLTPLQLPEASLTHERTAWSGGNRHPKPIAPDHPEIVPKLQICPGESSQLVARIQNYSSQAWDIWLGGSQTMPLEWCPSLKSNNQFEENDKRVLAGRETSQDGEFSYLDSEVSFNLPANFFEDSLAISSDNQRLKLNYTGHIQVYARPSNTQGTRQLMATAPFELWLRPHSRYLDYLPQVYRDVDFMGRLLSLFEQSFDPSVETLRLLWAYLDPRTASEQLLPFLAHWVGWNSDRNWSQLSPIQVHRQRQLIYHAMELYRWRGTQRGLRHYLQLYTGLPDNCISIESSTKLGFEIGVAELDTTAVIGGDRPYHFAVRLKPHPPIVSYSDLISQKEHFHTIIHQEKPAVCTFDLFIEESTQS